MARKYLDSGGLLYFWTLLKTKFANKVDKEDGKGLSTNDYTTTEKNKLAGIASGAEVNVNADWNATTGDAQILNKPTIPSKTSDLTNDIGFITTSDIPESVAASTTTPKMDGTAAVGTETAFARGDHRHPSDTTKADDDKVVHLEGVEIIKGSKTVTGNTTFSGDVKIISTLKIDALEGAGRILITEDDDPLWTSISDKTGRVTETLAQSLGKKADKTTTVNGHALSGNVTVSKSDVGLGNVENKSSATIRGEITSSNVTTALGFTPVDSTAVGAANGVCPLNASSKIDSTYLPSYVDDVIEAYARTGQTALSSTWLATGSASGTVITPESGKIYLLMNDSGDYSENTQFRYSGTTYVKLNDGGISEITNSEIDTIVTS